MHIPVLLKEVIAGLDLKPDDVFLDGTINGGGHSQAVSNLLGDGGMVIGLDMDNAALREVKKRLAGANPTVILRQSNFRNLDTALSGERITSVDKILFDLGLSSNQLEESGRGFTFRKNEPLLMTFKDRPEASDLTAERIVNHWDEDNIATIIQCYGEERFAKKIARAIIFSRARKEIKTTDELVRIIKEAVPKKFQNGRLHPATKTFQALRITVNDELGALRDGLERGFKTLAAGGRFAVISFHSLEDRVVKNFFKKKIKEGQARLVTKKPIRPSAEEESQNPRSRSAKLRIIEKTYANSHEIDTHEWEMALHPEITKPPLRETIVPLASRPAKARGIAVSLREKRVS